MSYHRALIAKLQKQGRWLVSGSAHTITLTKKFGKKVGKVVSVNLAKEVDGTYTIAPIDYEFRSTVSHFDYVGEEHRWARNKTFIRSLIASLKDVDIWDHIKNKETFIQINAHNTKVNKTMVKNQLNSLI
jgi:hypothetical protein